LKPEPAVQTAANQKSDSIPEESGVKPGNIGGSSNGSGTQTAEPAQEIRKAIPVQPQDKKPVEIRRAIPVKPLHEEGEDATLLKSATPVPADIDE
jgi:hypothetical protein